MPPYARVLDVGTGEAFYVGLYQRLGVRDVVAVDLSPHAIAAARAAYPHYRFEICDITGGLAEDLGRDRAFDCVSAMDMLYHIVEDDLFRDALAHCGRAVRQNGYLIVSDNFPARRRPADACQAYRTLDEHVRLLAPLGFELVDLSPVFFISNGQVSSGGLAGRMLSLYWCTISRTLNKTLRVWRGGGEVLGASLGFALTSIDAMLQRQHVFAGFSTKIAVFHRTREAIRTADASAGRSAGPRP